MNSYTGTVTDIETGAPLKNISVTDGRNVVKTDGNGRFQLEGYCRTHFIVVTTPAGYTTEAYYIPVDENRESYDFKLTRSEATAHTAHGFQQISDTEIGVEGATATGGWVRHVRETAKKTGAAFLIHTGDICYEAGLKQHKIDMNTDNMGLPVRYIIGNHDYTNGRFGEELFESIYGPVWYSFEIGNIHYVVTPIQFGDCRSAYDADDRWIWLANDLANTDPDMKLVVFNHDHARAENYVIPYAGKELDLKKHHLAAWVFGHYHYHYIEEKNGVLDISTARPDSGGIDSSASGTRYIAFDEEGQIRTKMYYYDMPSEVPAPEESIWSVQLDSPVLFTDTLKINGKVYTATADEDYPRTCGIYCLDEKTGTILWKVQTENAVRNNLVYADGRIVGQDADGNVICVHADTGEKIWNVKVTIEYTIGTSTGICTDGEVVYAGNASDVTALRLTDGEVLWRYHRDNGENSPAAFVLIGDKLIISPHWAGLAALDKHTGALLWENQDENIRFRSSTPAAIDEKTLLAADDHVVMLLDLETGKTIRKTVFEGYRFASSGQPVIVQGKAYIPTVTHGVAAFDIAAGEILWNAVPGIGMTFTSPYIFDCAIVEGTAVLVGGELVFGASDGYIYRVSAENGEVLSKTNVGAPILGKIVVCEDGTIIAGDFAGRITRFCSTL